MLKPFIFASVSLLGSVVASQAWAAKTVDVLVLYGSSAQASRNGADINARIASYVAYANQAYASSGVDMQLRLVAAQKLDLPISNVSEANLNTLRQNATVAQLRRQYGADVVSYLTLSQTVSGGSICGIGYIPAGNPTSATFFSDAPSLAFNLVGVDCNLNVLTHEVGHNMGL
ncbi:MAG TPA: zinc-dependent metalloprotease family protein, partial [Cellvibrionaceae bacterium]|nr:zinc-dependent metalloprotease family protein [Cellvibrionaceae bacterium]